MTTILKCNKCGLETTSGGSTSLEEIKVIVGYLHQAMDLHICDSCKLEIGFSTSACAPYPTTKILLDALKELIKDEITEATE